MSVKPHEEVTQIDTGAEITGDEVWHVITDPGGTPGDAGMSMAALDDRFEAAGTVAAHTGDATDAHDASAVSVADSAGLLTATEVEAALAELASGQAAVNVVAASGAAETLTLAPHHKVTMDENCEFTFPTPTAAGHTFTLHLIGAFTPTFPASVDWPGGVAPTYATPAIYAFHTDDTGTTWFGALFGGAGGFA